MPKVKMRLTCERLDEEANPRIKPPARITYNVPTSSIPTAKGLDSLLSRLPYEIRLNIYELCIPCMWHRKRKILLDYIVDCEWMATSPDIFYEAGALVLTKPLPFIYTKLSDGESLASVFDKQIRQAFPDDFEWVFPRAQSMIDTLAVTIRYPYFYRNVEYDGLAQQLKSFFETTDTFSNLGCLHISLGPDFFPVRPGRTPIFADDWEGEIDPSIEAQLEASAIVLKQVIPRTCKVIWRFDKAAMPTTYRDFGSKSDATLSYMNGINQIMERVWSQECSIERIANIEPGNVI